MKKNAILLILLLKYPWNRSLMEPKKVIWIYTQALSGALTLHRLALYIMPENYFEILSTTKSCSSILKHIKMCLKFCIGPE